MMSAPTVSVVIPCYNARAWIAETVASAVAQDGVPLEIVLVDDGSDDDSVEAARSAAGGLPLTILTQDRQGASRARNVGTRAARGRFIQYLDADDVLLPGTVRARVAALEATGADVAYCDWTRWEQRADGSFTEGAVASRRLGERPDLDLCRGAWWPPGALLYRRAVVDAIGSWREDLPVIQDARFLLDAALAGARFVHVPGVGLKYRVHPASLSRRHRRAFLDDCYQNANDLLDRWTAEGVLDDDRRQCAIDMYAHLARGFFSIDRARFRDVLRRLYALDPHFLPQGPPALRLLSRMLGYPRAEALAAAWRAARRAV